MENNVAPLKALFRNAEVAGRRLGDIALNERFARIYEVPPDERPEELARDIEVMVTHLRDIIHTTTVSPSKTDASGSAENLRSAAQEAIVFLEKATQWLHKRASR